MNAIYYVKNIMTIGKVLQRHAYDLLSHKYSVIIIIIAFSTLLVSVFQFGEVCFQFYIHVDLS